MTIVDPDRASALSTVRPVAVETMFVPSTVDRVLSVNGPK
jgi:hypothetical protein